MIARTTMISKTRRTTKRLIGSTSRTRSLRARLGAAADGVPLIDPERRGILMPGRRHAREPFRQDEGIRLEEQRQRRQLLGIKRLELPPQRRALRPVELGLDCVHQMVGLDVAPADEILPAPTIGG